MEIETKMEKPEVIKRNMKPVENFSTEINDLIRVENEIMHTIK
jgi:hypothetical protein